jgi:hypothetical protein
MRRFRPFSGHLSVMTAHRLALDGDFGVANAMMPNSRAPPISVITARSGMKVKEHRHPAIAFKTRGFEDFVQPRCPAPCRAAPPAPSQAKPAARSSYVLRVGNSPVVCHGKRDEVQCCAENERRVWRAHLMCSHTSELYAAACPGMTESTNARSGPAFCRSGSRRRRVRAVAGPDRRCR